MSLFVCLFVPLQCGEREIENEDKEGNKEVLCVCIWMVCFIKAILWYRQNENNGSESEEKKKIVLIKGCPNAN